MRRNRNRAKNRRGIASVEFAICVPVLIALTIGTIDLCSMLFLKEAVQLAAYEGARVGIQRGNTNQDCIDRVHEFLDERGTAYQTGQAITISGPGFNNADTLENVTVTVRVPAAGNLLIPSAMFGDAVLEASCTMRKEYANLD